MKKALLTILVGASFGLSAQTISSSVVGSSGGSLSGSNGTVSYTVGEWVTTTIGNNTAGYATQGFQQPSFKPQGIVSLPQNAPAMALYPNPANQDLTVAFSLDNGGDVTYNLYDMSGRLVLTTNTQAGAGQHQHSLNLASLSQGVYVLNISYQPQSGNKAFSVVKRLEVVR